MINTNGLRIATDDVLLDLLARHRTRAEVYLQFDGVSERAHRHHRGGDLRAQKLAAIERLTGAGIFTTLTMTAALGVNDTEIGDVIQLALATPYVGGVSIQPVFSSGRGGAIDPMARLTHTGVLARLATQPDSLVKWDDLTALPCSHPHCCSVGYMIRTDSGQWRSLVQIIGPEKLAENLGLVANRIADREIPKQLRAAVKDSLLDLLSERTSLTHPDTARIWTDICTACDIGLSTLLRAAATALPGREEALRRMLAERIVRITVKPFMDIHTMIEPRLTQCCVHVGTRGAGGDQCAPFCAVQAWPELNAQRLPRTAGAGAVPRRSQ
jgi:hypothetical protein